MVAREIKKGIHAVGALDWDRRLFDELIPLPDGTTYNSYIIQGSDKTALIDTVDPSKVEEFFENLGPLDLKDIDYVIANHAEQDHSGAIPQVLAKYPNARIVTNTKCKEMLLDLLHIQPDKFIVVGDGEKLDLGGRTLEFIFAPWVHWPETMFTYLCEDKILFSCDFLGSHLATSDLYAIDEAKVYIDAKRYYAEIMMPFRVNIKKHLERIKPLSIDMIAPSHGPIYNRPKFIIDAYHEWISDDVKNEVVIPYVSMHGSTAKAVEHLVDQFEKRDIGVLPFNLSGGDLGALAIALVDAATVIIAAPTVLAGPHPTALFAAALIGALRPKTKFLGIVESYGWGARAAGAIDSLLSNLKVERIGTALIKGLPKAADLKALDEIVDRIADRHRALGLLNPAGV